MSKTKRQIGLDNTYSEIDSNMTNLNSNEIKLKNQKVRLKQVVDQRNTISKGTTYFNIKILH